MPEPLLFATSLLQTFCEQWQSKPATARGWSLQLVPESKEMTAAAVIPLTFSLAAESACSKADFAVSCVNAAVGLMKRAAEAHADVLSFPELFAPALALMQELQFLQHSLPEVNFNLTQSFCRCLHKVWSLFEVVLQSWWRHALALFLSNFNSLL